MPGVRGSALAGAPVSANGITTATEAVGRGPPSNPKESAGADTAMRTWCGRHTAGMLSMVYDTCMSRTNIDIDDEACAAVMRRYRLASKREAVNLALRTLAAEPLSLDEARRLRGSGWEGDLDEMRRIRAS